jgi:predicted DCC family thiol-disulfide oxidoreductase YuxK
MPAAEADTVAKADPAKGRAIVLFDGNCPLCRRSVRSLKRLDWLGWLHFQDCRDTANLPRTAVSLHPDRLLEEMHLVTPDRKRVHPGYRAFRWMAWRIPATWWLAPLLYLPGMRWLGTRLYRWVARNRFNLVPCNEGGCAVPRRGTGAGNQESPKSDASASVS